MQIKLWTPNSFKKKSSSTKRPTGGTTIEGYFRNSDTFSMFAPTVRIDFSKMPNMASTTVPPYTYAYIPNFSRYYFIVDWSHTEGVWTAALQEDVLSSWRTEIGETDIYVLRSSAESNPSLEDSKYPISADLTHTQHNVGNVIAIHPNLPQAVLVPNFWNTAFQSGVYLMNVYGPNTTGITTFYMTYQGFKALADALYAYDPTTSGLWDTLTTELPMGFAKAVADPIQFIESVKWMPFSPFPAPTSYNLNLGYYNIGTINGISEVRPQDTVVTYQCYLPIDKHPQAADRGKWLNTEPYSSYTLRLPPFGEFPLDTAKLLNYDQLNLRWTVDYCSGMGKLYIFAVKSQSPSEGVYLGCVEAKCAVEITLNQNTINLSEGVLKSSLMMGAIGAIGNVGNLLAQNQTENTAPPSIFDQFKEMMDSWMTPHGGSGGGGGSSWGDEDLTIWEGGKLDWKKVLPNLGNLYDSATAGGTKGIRETIHDIASAAVGGFKSFNPGLAPKLHAVGGIASYLTYSSGYGGAIYAEFATLADDDNSSLGRPLCKIRKPKDIPGYILAENPKIEGIGTRAETEAIKAFMTGGFFYE